MLPLRNSIVPIPDFLHVLEEKKLVKLIASDRNRTDDLSITSAAPYRLATEASAVRIGRCLNLVL